MGKTNQLGVLADVFTSDASNNVGIGAAPSGSYKLEVTGTAKVSSTLLVSGAATFGSTITASGNLNLQAGAVRNINFYDSSNTNINAQIQYDQISATSGQLFFGTNNAGTFATRLTITNAGNVGIGTSSPVDLLTLNVTSASTVLQFQNGGVSKALLGVSYTASDLINNSAAGDLNIRCTNSQNINFSTNNGGTLGMRITSGGEVLIGRTTTFSTFGDSTGIVQYGAGTIYCAATSNEAMGLSRRTTDGIIILFRKDGTTVGSISTNANSLPSDKNFKKNINNLDLGLNIVSKLRPVSYNHKIDDEGTALSTGFIAQELEQSLTELGVEQNKYHILQNTPNEDETQSQYWLDYTKMIPVLVKAIQELSAQNQDLKSRLDKAGL